MSAPVVKHNTFMGCKDVDNISKMFIALTYLLGANRIGVLDNVKRSYFYFSLVYSSALTAFVSGYGVVVFHHGNDYLLLIIVAQYTFVNILVVALRGRLQRFYEELQQFDEKIGLGVHTSRNSINNLIQMSLVLTVSMLFMFIYPKCEPWECRYYYYVMILLSPLTAQCFELYYLGHLIGMFAPRIRLVSYHIRVSYPVNDCKVSVLYDSSFTKFKKEMKRRPKIAMGDLMDLYYSIIKAYDYLNESVKWQLLIILMATFAVSMGVAYTISNDIISGNIIIEEALANVSFIFLDIFPMFTICYFAEQVCKEVVRLRDTISSSLYENNFDKTTRTAAQAFFGLTEARDLSFSLFNMFNIGITLPFNFLSLILTYLIILLQFEKVISPKGIE